MSCRPRGGGGRAWTAATVVGSRVGGAPPLVNRAGTGAVAHRCLVVGGPVAGARPGAGGSASDTGGAGTTEELAAKEDSGDVWGEGAVVGGGVAASDAGRPATRTAISPRSVSRPSAGPGVVPTIVASPRPPRSWPPDPE